MGGGSKKQTVGYKYYLGVHMILCHGPIDKITRLDVDDRNAWTGLSTGGSITVNAPNLFGGDEREGGISGKVDVAMGGTTQTPNTYLDSKLAGAIPAFRLVVGLILNKCYMGNNPYLKRWSARGTRIHLRQNGLAQWYDAKADVGGDMNPAHIVREVLTDPDWGMGYPELDMDDVAFQAAADTLFTEGMGISILWDKQKPLHEFLADILAHIDGSLYIDRQTGKFVLKLSRGGYSIPGLLQLDESNVQKISDFRRPTVAELTNQVSVVFWDKTTGKNNSVTVQDIALAAQQGSTVGTTLQYPGFTNTTIATKVASRDLKSLSTPLATATIYANREAAALNIGDVFKFSWAEYGVEQVIFRVTNIELGELSNNLIKLTVVEDVFALSEAVYAPPPPSEWESPITAATPATFRVLMNAPYYMLARELGDTDAGNLPATATYMLVAAVQPGNAINAQVHVDEGAGYSQAVMLDFAASCTTTADVAATGASSTIPITGGVNLDQVAVGDYVLFGTGVTDLLEIGTVTSITDTSLVCKRGMMDTTPTSVVTSGTRLLFIGKGELIAALPNEYAAGESISVKVLPVTGQGALAIGSASADTLVAAGRQDKPYPPGKPRLNTLAYPATITGELALTWAHRDRLQQTAETIVDQDAANVGPEAGTTYTLRLYAQPATTLRRTVTGLTGTSYNWVAESFDTPGMLSGEITSTTWSQSGTAAGQSAASNSNMRDGSFTTGTVTVVASNQFVQADLGSSLSVAAVGLAGGILPVGPTPTGAILATCLLQSSPDASTWTNAPLQPTNATDDNGMNVLIFASPVTARYWRIFRAAAGPAVATTEFRFWATAARPTALRVELESVRDSLTSHFKHNITTGR